MKSVQVYRPHTRLLNPGVIILLITLIAFAARVWQLDSVPPGWRDDELINSLVISQKVLDGDWALYYPDASGHESLYHVLNAGMLTLFGPGVPGIRLLSVFLGTMTIPLVYLVGNRLFGLRVGLLAAAGLAISFWALMYSRVGLRHVSLPILMLGAFYFFLRALGISNSTIDAGGGSGRRSMLDFSLAGIFMGLGFYTYFAARGVPLILLAVLVYILIFYREVVVQRWRGLLLMLATALILALPLIITLTSQPESEARVQELAVPLVEARAGNFQPLANHIVRTINMFHSDGDEEWLYNIPFRPVFSPFLAVVFWSGMAIAIYYAFKPINVILSRQISRLRNGSSLVPRIFSPTPALEIAGAFLLIWWLMGIMPAFVSVPPASLGHTIVAQPATYIVLALPVFGLAVFGQRMVRKGSRVQMEKILPLAFAAVLLVSMAGRDLPDYFQKWPGRGMTRFLYRADLSDVAGYLKQHPEMTDFGVTGLLAGPWDGEALAISLAGDSDQRPRWYNPERVVLLRVSGEPALSFSGYPVSTALEELYYQPLPGETAGGYQLTTLKKDIVVNDKPICFQNNLCLLAADFDPALQILELTFELQDLLEAPPRMLISNPPPPDTYAGSRLNVFSQLLDESGAIISGDDGIWIDIHTLLPGDRFLQQHHFNLDSDTPPNSVIFGLYDPMTGKRILTEDGRDHLQIEAGSRSN